MDQPSTSKNSRKRRRVVAATSEDFENTLQTWLEKETEGDFSDVDDDQADPDFFLQSDHETESEQSEDEQENENQLQTRPTSVPLVDVNRTLRSETTSPISILSGNQKYYYGKNGYKWSSEEPINRSSRTASHNIVDIPPRQPKTFIDSESLWLELFDTKMIDTIVTCTNQKLSQVCTKYKNPDKVELRSTDREEMKAFLGLLFYTSVFKSNHENTKCLFATDGSGREIFRCVMSQFRFLTLLNYIRFDDSNSRSQRLETDPLAAISEIFGLFIANCKKAYTPGAYLCVDEMLVSFRGRCKFIIYMPKKPAKYGLKILVVCDAETFYVHNAYIYHGKDSDGLGLPETERKLAIPTQSVLRLCKDFEKTNRNITADNWFSSIELMEQLKDRGLTYVGTLKKNKRHIPPEFQASKTRSPESSLHGFTKDFTIVSYVPKKSKAVLLISSMHHTKQLDPLTKKPEIIMDYNRTKGGVDEIDKKCSNYSSSRRTRRWPLAIFFRILDLSGVNAYALYKTCTAVPNISRAQYLQDLARSLVLPHLKRRVYNNRLPRELRLTISRVLGTDKPPEPEITAPEDTEAARKTCKICPSRLKRRTKYSCIECRKAICLGCSKTVCVECADNK
ncbi:piggyBac transposable element-derived protein 4-like [Melitaea cinxia]|uniref:piggyBac transposable element-derived protein 4-like n=1 Tax=Melitaea cinxia TaxID=113334 RepID=UPI001E274906|nr:piggyBac transposable element-derived protein 4-like [Melitaea cinxia]